MRCSTASTASWAPVPAPTRGSGIGLALVAELTALHGGSVGVRSAPGQGSTFTVRVPFGSAHLPPDQLGPSSQDPSPAAVPHVRGYLAEVRRWVDSTLSGAAPESPSTAPRILVVDDNSDMRDYIRHILDADYRVVEAADGGRALAMTRADPPDPIL